MADIFENANRVVVYDGSLNLELALALGETGAGEVAVPSGVPTTVSDGAALEGTSRVTLAIDPSSGTSDVVIWFYVAPPSGSSLTGWYAANNGSFSTTGAGLIDRLNCSGFQRIYVQATSGTPVVRVYRSIL